MAERCAVFVIIALDESLWAVGGTFVSDAVNESTISGFCIAFVSNVAMWWLYLYRSATQGQDCIARSSQPGHHGVVARIYFHLPIVAGIILSAVADHMVSSGHEGQASALVTVSEALHYFSGFFWRCRL